MGHGPDSARATLGRVLLLALGLTAACGTGLSTDPAEDGPLLLVAVTGLRADDPVVSRALPAVQRSSDTVASGTGASAVLELLDGRPALEQLREPANPFAWTSNQLWSAQVDVMDPSVRSAPEWVHAHLDWQFVEEFPQPAAADLHVVVVPRSRIDDEALLALLTPRPGPGVIVVGIPERPTPFDDAEQVLSTFQVPVLTNGSQPAVRDARTLADVLAPLRGEVRRPAERLAHWWDSRGGGVLVERPGGWVVGGSSRTPVALGADVDAAATIDSALEPGSLLVMIRGSEGADLTSMEVLSSVEATWSAWGLEPIDTVHHASLRYLQLDLAAEPEGDGILIADAHLQKIDVRLLSPLEDAPVIGAPIRDAASGRWIGIDGIRIQPWSRNYWTLTRRSNFDADSWWRRSSAGIDLLWVHGGTRPPAPVLFED
jgi:hypothetical protein